MLNNDYKEILQLLKESNVEFLLVGAYALAIHGYPRSTGDIDIWIKSTPENSNRVFDVINKFGAPFYDLSAEDLQKPGNVFQIGIAPRRIDILTSITGVEFSDAYGDHIDIEMDGLLLPFISLKKLIQNKEATGRNKDLEDVEKLKKLMRE